MKKIFISTFSFLFSILLAFHSFAMDFVSGFEDIPLMEGLKQIESDDIAFGNEETRYLEAQLVAVRKKSFQNIKDFYIKTLPQLGWTLKESSASFLRFYRETDILEINRISENPLKISISLKNKN